jgi:hypothetical protein
VVPASFTNVLLASAGASAALIGLLFVAVSIAPARVFGHRAEVRHHAAALSAFIALSNAFFISLGGLIPTVPIGAFVLMAGCIAAGQTLSLLRLWSQWQRERRLFRGVALFLGSASLYGYEIWTARLLVRPAVDMPALSTLCELLLGTYAVGLARAWELLGAPHSGIVSELRAWLGPRQSSDGAGDGAPHQDSTHKRQGP